MLEYQESGMKTTSGHRISFSIIDILDPKKFTSKRTVSEEERTSSSGNTEFGSLEEQRNGKGSLSICNNIGENEIRFIKKIRVRIIR